MKGVFISTSIAVYLTFQKNHDAIRKERTVLRRPIAFPPFRRAPRYDGRRRPPRLWSFRPQGNPSSYTLKQPWPEHVVFNRRARVPPADRKPSRASARVATRLLAKRGVWRGPLGSRNQCGSIRPFGCDNLVAAALTGALSLSPPGIVPVRPLVRIVRSPDTQQAPFQIPKSKTFYDANRSKIE